MGGEVTEIHGLEGRDVSEDISPLGKAMRAAVLECRSPEPIDGRVSRLGSPDHVEPDAGTGVTGGGGDRAADGRGGPR